MELRNLMPKATLFFLIYLLKKVSLETEKSQKCKMNDGKLLGFWKYTPEFAIYGPGNNPLFGLLYTCTLLFFPPPVFKIF